MKEEPLYPCITTMASENVSTLSDEALVKLVQENDQELYTEIVQRYELKLMRYAVSLVRDNTKAQDIVQNAFIKAFVNLRSFNQKLKFSSWIYRITHNEAINEIKKYRREVSLDDLPELENIPSNDASAEEVFDANRMKEMLSESLEQLPALYREPLVLLFFEERSYQEISDILRLPMGTVGTRINRGKTLLRKIHSKLHDKTI